MNKEFQTDGEFDIYKMLNVIRQRPGLYVGTLSLSSLWHYLNGYRSALLDNKIAYREVGPWNNIPFDNWIRKHLDLPYNCNGWANNILKQCNVEEAKALNMFLELVELFRQQESATGEKSIEKP